MSVVDHSEGRQEPDVGDPGAGEAQCVQGVVQEASALMSATRVWSRCNVCRAVQEASALMSATCRVKVRSSVCRAVQEASALMTATWVSSRYSACIAEIT